MTLNYLWLSVYLTKPTFLMPLQQEIGWTLILITIANIELFNIRILKNMQQITISSLFMGFLGLTEEQVDLYQPYGNAFQKITKQRLEANMEAIIYVLSACQSFMLIIDHVYGHKVVTQKTYWTDLDKYYEMLRKKAIPNKSRWDSTGFYIASPQLGDILVEKYKRPNDDECIAASINV